VFRSLAEAMGAAVHISVTGDDDHHKTEAVYKGFGRALRQAIRIEGDAVPSTKARVTVAIVHLGAGNTASVQFALERLGATVRLTADAGRGRGGRAGRPAGRRGRWATRWSAWAPWARPVGPTQRLRAAAARRRCSGRAAAVRRAVEEGGGASIAGFIPGDGHPGNRTRARPARCRTWAGAGWPARSAGESG